MITLTFIFLLFPLMVNGQGKICTVEHPYVDEQSAIIRGSQNPDVFWVLNDSGDDARIFGMNAAGEVIIPLFLKKKYSDDKNDDHYPGIRLTGATNTDWEALARFGDTLVVADMGNNGNARRDLGVYLVLEPNPNAIYMTRPFAWIPVAYEDQKQWPAEQWEFDCEAVFSFQDKLYFLTKHRSDQRIDKPAQSTKLYRLDSRSTDKVNTLVKIGQLGKLGGWVTDADIAPDESSMAMLVQNPLISSIWLFPRPEKGDNFLAESPQIYHMKKVAQAEGLCFKNDTTLILTNEQREWFEIPLAVFSK